MTAETLYMQGDILIKSQKKEQSEDHSYLTL